MVNIPHGQMLKKEFLKDNFLLLFFSDNLASNLKLLANDTSLFLVVQDITLREKFKR